MLRGSATRLEPEPDRLLVLAGRRVVMREQFWLQLPYLGRQFLQHFRALRVKLLSPGSHQSRVGGILDQRVLKHVSREGTSAFVHELGAQQFTDGPVQRLPVQAGEGRKMRI